jgi:hypothetical protein
MKTWKRLLKAPIVAAKEIMSLTAIVIVGMIFYVTVQTDEEEY